jgi:nicotinamide riboside transporter PnuC
MSPHLYWSLLALTCAYAFIRGGRDERVVAIVSLVASVTTAFVLSPWGQRYSQIEAGELLVDLSVLAAFILVALRSDRFWPLWVAGLQLTSSLAHLMKGIHIELLPQAYAAATKFWSYPILVIILVGTWRSHQRARREQRSRSA